MEGDRIFEDSLNEIARVKKQLGSDFITIEMKKLDAQTKNEITSALQNVLSKRSHEVEKVVLGVK